MGKEDEFVPRMTDLVNQWRKDWGDPDASMPFYMVEIAPYLYSRDNGDSGARLRKAQHDAAKAIPNSAIVCTNDLVASFEADNIHPCRKEPIGNRLAYIALNRDYGFKQVACESPEAVALFKGQPQSNEINVRLANCPHGIDRFNEIEGLEVCGADGVWHPVSRIRFNASAISIAVDEVQEPKAVRYGWADFRPGNIHSVEGLPLVPFCLTLE